MQSDRDTNNWNDAEPNDRSNAQFEEYYRVSSPLVSRRLLRSDSQAQNILADDEWPEFLTSLRSELPLTFRVTGSRA